MEISMRKKIILSLMLSACASSALYAGAMGPVELVEPAFKPFLIGEAAYSWPQVSGLNVDFQNLAHLNSNAQVQGWGGRVAAGIMRSISERFALSFEGGLMYNDHINFEPRFTVSGAQVIPPGNVITANFDQYGFDMLAGLIYTQPKYDLFFKAGALFENMRSKVGVNMSEILRNNRRQGNFVAGASQQMNINVAQVMPEIKLGGNYHVNENWAVTASWMHAFGGTLGISADQINLTSGSATIGSIAAHLNNPTINSVMFGVEYLFS